MRRSVAVAVGYALWSVLWLGYGAILRGLALLPADDAAVIDGVTPLLLLLLGSMVASLVAGYTTNAIGRTVSYVPVLVMGLLLFVTGVFVQSQYWHLMPLWYHVLFLGLLLPMCFVGRRINSV